MRNSTFPINIEQNCNPLPSFNQYMLSRARFTWLFTTHLKESISPHKMVQLAIRLTFTYSKN